MAETTADHLHREATLIVQSWDNEGRGIPDEVELARAYLASSIREAALRKLVATWRLIAAAHRDQEGCFDEACRQESCASELETILNG